MQATVPLKIPALFKSSDEELSFSMDLDKARFGPDTQRHKFLQNIHYKRRGCDTNTTTN